MAWATLANRFFSSAVRLQTDRGQVVVDSGPYQFVRHPGYTGAIPYLVFGGLALGSWLATVIAGVPMIVILLRRTVLEDKMLLEGLAGYKEYAARVKYRLAPGIW
jgi:protein-S-isoprenylcysteine O-methyltransferase Ste14